MGLWYTAVLLINSALHSLFYSCLCRCQWWFCCFSVVSKVKVLHSLFEVEEVEDGEEVVVAEEAEDEVQ